jgi:hypothetical protein
MTSRRALGSGRRTHFFLPLVFAIGFAIAFVQAAGCSTSGSSSDGSGEGGQGGAGGTSTGGSSG